MARKKIQFNRTGVGTEPFWKSRRVWAAALTLLATIGIVVAPDQYELVVGAAGLIASGLGITSWVKPKA